MSKYTTELRFICESEAGYLEQQGYSKVNEIVEAARSKIFSFDYPIFDTSYKAGLETKILKHYYTREIAAETYGRWKLFLESRMLEIMPYYNELYRSTLQEYNIFEDVNYIRSGNRTTDEDGTHNDQDVTATETSNTGTVATTDVIDTDTTDTGSTQTETADEGSTSANKVIDTDTTETGTAWDKYSDTPQGSVQNIDNDSYLTNARKNTINNTGTNDTRETDTGSTSNTGTVETTTNAAGTVDTTETINTSTSDTGTIDTTSTNTGSHTRDVLEEYSELIKGKMPGRSYMQMIQEFRDVILNIDKMIIDELTDLFMMVY